MTPTFTPTTPEPPLIRLRRSGLSHIRSLRRLTWIYGKLLSFHSQRMVALACSAVLLVSLNPTITAQASEAVGPASSESNAALADFSFTSLEEMKNPYAIVGFTAKPLLIATEMGRPEKTLLEQKSAQAKKKAALAAAAAAKKKTAPAPVAKTTSVETPAKSISTGNSYPYGYCTWWAKQKRPDLPNQLGNAKNWLSSAAARGYATGKTPQVGAIVVTSESRLGHVGYVEAIEGNQLIVSDMNVVGLGKLSKRHMSINSGVIRGYIY